MTPGALALGVALMSAAVGSAPLAPPRPALPPAPQAVPLVVVPEGTPGGIVCRDPRLTGIARPDIIDVGALACGIDDPVSVTAIGGVKLSQPALLGCRTARSLADWLGGVVRAEAIEHLQSPVAEVWVMGTYACRTRNGVAGGKMSEHSRGRAIDIGGFTLKNGQKVTVARDWGSNPKGDFLKRVWRKGCGAFHTVLGPDADRHHHDHLHLDTSPRGGTPWCR